MILSLGEISQQTSRKQVEVRMVFPGVVASLPTVQCSLPTAYFALSRKRNDGGFSVSRSIGWRAAWSHPENDY